MLTEKVDCKFSVNARLINNGVYRFTYNIKLTKWIRKFNVGGVDKYHPKTRELSSDTVINLQLDGLISHINK